MSARLLILSETAWDAFYDRTLATVDDVMEQHRLEELDAEREGATLDGYQDPAMERYL
jgi:hypothetical protein